jgi:hypothetical protein
MTDGVFHGPAFIVPARQTRTWPLFLALISLATLLPFALAPLVGHVFPADSPAIGVYAVLTFLASNFHVALTGWFYTDRDMRGHFRSKPVRYLIVPGAIVAINVIAFCFLDSAIRLSIVFIFICWLLWHYQKQNVGLLSFIAAGTDRVPLSAWERRTLALSAIAGISGCFSLMHFGPANLSTVFAQFHQVGAAIYLVLVPLSFSIALIRNPILRTNPLRLVFFVIGTLFFLPTYIFSDSVSALAGYMLAHGLQYFVFMSFVSTAKERTMGAFAKLCAIALCGGILLDHAQAARTWLAAPYAGVIYGLFIGLVMSHFVLDAGIWRLREPFQRSYMRQKFDFIFGR